MPWLDELLQQYPALSVRLELSDKISALQSEQVDLAIRYGELADSSLVSFELGYPSCVMCSACSIWPARGYPVIRSNYNSYNRLLYLVEQWAFANWHFQGPQQPFSVSVSGNRISNDAEVVKRWAVSGQGIALKSALDMSEDLLAGRVVPLLPEVLPAPQLLHLVCVNRNQIFPRQYYCSGINCAAGLRRSWPA